MEIEMRGLVVSCLVMLGVILGHAPIASAVPANPQGYACSVQYSPNIQSVGYVTVSLYSGPKCTGTVFGTYFIYSVGTTVPNTWANYYYREPALLAVFQELRHASQAGLALFLGTYQNNPAQIQTVFFYPY